MTFSCKAFPVLFLPLSSFYIRRGSVRNHCLEKN